jgi:hypothetical protein
MPHGHGALLTLCLAAVLLGAHGCASDTDDFSPATDDAAQAGSPPGVFAVGGALPGGAGDNGQDASAGDQKCQSTLDCNDFDDCTTDVCDSKGECMYIVVPCSQTCFLDFDCDDEDPCTKDECGDDKECVHTAIDPCEMIPCTKVDDCDDSDSCTQDACLSGYCSYQPAPGCQVKCEEDTKCDDDDPCTDDSCDKDDGLCQHKPIDCDDNDTCTDDSCNEGCVNEPVSCDDSDPCTKDTCEDVTGCVHSPDGCDDGNLCTTDSCDPASGCSHASIACDDGDQCTVDSCLPESGCTATTADLPCDDGDTCTAEDQCRDGQCAGSLHGATVYLTLDAHPFDSSGLEHRPELGAEFAWKAPGRVGSKSISFLGSLEGYLRIPADHATSTTFTLALWVNPTDQADRAVFSRRIEGGGAMALSTTGKLTFGATELVGDALPVATWTHVAVTRSEEKLSLYVDGALAGEAVAPAISGWGGDLWIAQLDRANGSGLDPTASFSGAVDEIYLRESALGPSEIQSLAVGGVPECADGDACTLDLCADDTGECTHSLLDPCP